MGALTQALAKMPIVTRSNPGGDHIIERYGVEVVRESAADNSVRMDALRFAQAHARATRELLARVEAEVERLEFPAHNCRDFKTNERTVGNCWHRWECELCGKIHHDDTSG